VEIGGGLTRTETRRTVASSDDGYVAGSGVPFVDHRTNGTLLRAPLVEATNSIAQSARNSSISPGANAGRISARTHSQSVRAPAAAASRSAASDRSANFGSSRWSYRSTSSTG